MNKSEAQRKNRVSIWHVIMMCSFIALEPASAVSAVTSDANTNEAATASKSTYTNSNNRPDPFLPVKLKNKSFEAKVVLDDRELHLEGILWHPTTPAAIVNRQRIG